MERTAAGLERTAAQTEELAVCFEDLAAGCTDDDLLSGRFGAYADQLHRRAAALWSEAARRRRRLETQVPDGEITVWALARAPTRP
ncbi:hypothetical protein [Actinomadura fibrosa]|uniref:Uncharacterized protein n=1 Tax=Actinomadura fibrosa TaxID=111802 RepID=A0ABW2XXV9_9ACTN|nr:hypothetical protein [Actinomadura fibrosa]